MTRLVGIKVMGALLLSAFPAFAQTAAPQTQTSSQTETRPATASVSGDTGLWFVPTAGVLPHKKWSVSFYRENADYGQGFTDATNFPLSFAVGIKNRMELFASFTTITRIDRDTRPIFFTSPAGAPTGAGGGIVNEYPLVTQGWIGNKRGDLRLGAKVALLTQDDNTPIGLALRGGVKLPTGDDESGASTGKADFSADAILSKYFNAVELSAFAGGIFRGNPDGFTLTDGLRWGFGLAVPARSRLRFTAELTGERYFDKVVIAPASFSGVDGSIAPTSTTLSNPIYAALGATWQSASGFFVGAGVNWSGSLDARSEARCPIASLTCTGFGDNSGDSVGIQFRIGYHPGAHDAVAAAAAAAARRAAEEEAARRAAQVTAPAPVTPPPANRPPTVRAACDPCTVEVGKMSTVSADAQDPDGDPLSYRWTANSGSLTSPTMRQSPWTAPMVVGPVPVTVTVNDGRGGTASASVTIQVVQPAIKDFVFEDVHFEFDRYTLRADALRVLDEAIAAMQANASLRLEIEGHTCNIGTAEYNLALGERRAAAVREYLSSRGINADRLRIVSYGEERPKHDNNREETRRLNRRAALVVRLQ
jgi:outer membrane protein OmpA-like peptidoglycan-associated protein